MLQATIPVLVYKSKNKSHLKNPIHCSEKTYLIADGTHIKKNISFDPTGIHKHPKRPRCHPGTRHEMFDKLESRQISWQTTLVIKPARGDQCGFKKSTSHSYSTTYLTTQLKFAKLAESSTTHLEQSFKFEIVQSSTNTTFTVLTGSPCLPPINLNDMPRSSHKSNAMIHISYKDYYDRKISKLRKRECFCSEAMNI